jgi:hypothetical protein
MARRRSGKEPNNGAESREASPPPAGYFLSLSLENVRCFGPKQTLDLSDGKGRPARWTILLGENGTGKTTVLQAAVDCVRIFAADPYREPADPAKAQLIDGHSIYARLHRQAPTGVQIEAKFFHGGGFSSSIPVPASSEGSVQLAPASGGMGISWSPPRENNVRAELPAIYAYGAGRRLGPTSLSQRETDDPAMSLFSDSAFLRNAEEWLLQLDYSASKTSPIQDRQKARREQVQRLLCDILPEVEATRFSDPSEAQPTPQVEFETPYGWVHLRQLGYGYQTLIAWMVDFASRMVERYPDSADPLAEPAVVLVDEIDLHLHPRWQRDLIAHLTRHFPNTQFIATAHSPLVVQAASDANLAVLRREGDRAVIDNDVQAVRGWRIDQIYTSDLFGLQSARPPELDEPLRRRKEILSKPELTEEDKRELAALEAQIGSLPLGETAEHAETMRLIQETLLRLEKEKAPSP